MSKYILVHDVPTGNPIVIHSDDIRLITKSEKYTGASQISGYIGDVVPEPFVHVTETPEQIFEMLK